MPGLTIRALAVACVIIALSCIALAAWTLDITIDEHYHIDYPRKIVDGQLPGRSEGMYNSKTPALLPGVWAERLAMGAGVTAPQQLLAVTRLTSALYFVALLVIVFFLARRFAGPQAAWVAVLCCALEPNLIAHASLNTVDVAFATANLLALWAMVAFGGRAGWKTALALGAALGLAFTIKFTGLYLVPAAVSLPLWKKDGRWPTPREGLRRAGWLALALLVSMLVISASYYFRDFGKPLSQHDFVSPSFRLLAEWLGWLRLPLPEQYLLGIDAVVALERAPQNVVLFDRWFAHGIWYYFAVLWFFKTPIALMAASIAGVWTGLRAGAFRQPGMAVLVFQWALYFAYFSFVFQAQVGYRYMLTLVPITFLFLAVGLKHCWTKPRGALLAAVIAALSLAELAPYYGHTLPFSNSFLLPKKDAYRVLADSNLYWGEYHTQIPGLLAERGVQASINPFHILPGGNAFDALELAGIFLEPDRPVYRAPQQHKWARENLQTSGHVKHGIFLYDVSERDFSRFLDDTRRYGPSALSAECRNERHRTIQVAGRDASWMLLCASAATPSDISFRALTGRAQVGHVGREGRCSPEPVRKGQEIWFRLEPGQHVLCLKTEGGLSGMWEIRGGTASFQTHGGGT